MSVDRLSNGQTQRRERPGRTPGLGVIEGNPVALGTATENEKRKMEYKRYPTYRDSGIEWLTVIPEHWDESIVSALFEDNKRKNKGSAEQNLLSLSYGRIINKDINTEEGLLPASFETYQIVDPDYIVLRLTDLQNDQRSLRVGHVRERGIITSAYTALKKKSFRMSSARYFYYLLHAYDLMKVFYGMGAGVRQSLGYDELKKIRLLLPAEGEQQSIVQFLDRETARIDALIEKKQRLIELLKEKRQAVITQAVTKGLAPHVPMMDSGVEWLGEMPEHWSVMNFGLAITRIEQGWSPNASAEPCNEGEWGVLKLSAIKNGRFDPAENKSLLDETVPDPSIEVRVGDLLITRANTPKLVGDACYVVDTAGRRLMMSDLVYRILPSAHGEPSFVRFLLISNFMRSQIEVDARGSSMTMAKISQSHIRAWKIPVPPVSEQESISAYLEKETTRLDSTVAKISSSVELLKEHRSALITAAVTGQIDVRDFNKESSNAA